MFNNASYDDIHSLFSASDGSLPQKHRILMHHKSILIFSGGSALNPFVTMLQEITENITYVLPVSDDGGSTAEIVRIVGGPGIGDIRSRLIRLAETKTPESESVYELLNYRLPSISTPLAAKNEWHEIVEGSHSLWMGISEPYRETIRAFLCHFNHELLRQSGTRGAFDFRSGSIGNFFLTGSRLFFNSLEAAIFQFARITRIPENTKVVPVNTTNASQAVRIAALLRNGKTIAGQCEISHPGSSESDGARLSGSRRHSLHASTSSRMSHESVPHIVPDNVLISTQNKTALNLPVPAVNHNINFSKTSTPPLPAPIRRIYYINAENQEVPMKINPLLIPDLSGNKKTIIYAMGSLYTSIIPCLIVPGMGKHLFDEPCTLQRFKIPEFVKSKSLHSITPSATESNQNQPLAFIPKHLRGERKRDFSVPLPRMLNDDKVREDENTLQMHTLRHTNLPQRVKILLLNGSLDRETEGYTALDFIFAITDALNYSCLLSDDVDATNELKFKNIYLEHDGLIDYLRLRNLKKHFCGDEGRDLVDGEVGSYFLKSEAGRSYLGYPYPPGAYITHLVITEDSTVSLNVSRIESFGILCCKVRSKVNEFGTESVEKGYYDVEELKKLLEPLVM
ncbi:hypothetical protein HK098_002212 [Nowakowskiella sp. JEL0407]|nr:hypothetical protein HK098_002212 [Nowakowskiella sp. JEL0407]